MASIATHFIFSNDVLRALPADIQELIRKAPDAYFLGAQGPDIFFYDVIHLMLTHDKNNIGSRMHTFKTDHFFAEYLSVLLSPGKNADKNIPAIAYLYGMLTHYSLDSMIHPFVYYMSESKDSSKNKKANDLCSIENHLQLETNIDEIFFYERFGTGINNVKRKNFMKPSVSEIEAISPVLANAINKTYGYHLKPSYIRGTIKRACICNSLLQNNNNGKKRLFSFVEKKLTGASRCSRLMFDSSLPDFSCMNEEHNLWRVPLTHKIKYDSVYDIYNKALKRANRLIKSCSTCLSSDNINSSDMIRKFAKETGGLSYHTGEHYKLG